MLRKSFFSFLALTFLFNVTAFAQFNLIKDFDGGSKSSFSSDYSGILYSIGAKVVVEYDSISAGQYTGLTSVAAVDRQGHSQRLTSMVTTNDRPMFFDFITLSDGRIAFVARATNGASKIIISNGTQAGSIEAYTSSYSINGLELISSGLYFTHEGAQGYELMHIDLSTLVVSQVKAFGDFYYISDISKVSGTSLIFMAQDTNDNNLKLYVSDGTLAGTTILATINTSSAVDQNTVMTQVGNKVYFFYKKPGVDCCNDLWVTDGTVAGTVKIKEFSVVFFVDYVREGKAIAWNNKFYFAAVPTGGNMNNDESLWVSDGTLAGTVRLNDPADYEAPRNFTVFKNQLYFIAYSNSSYANKLYKTDGTAAGTGYVSLSSGITALSPYAIAADADYLYLAGDNITYGAEVYRYNGTQAVCEVADGTAGSGASDPDKLFVNGTDLYFVADLTATGSELYTAATFGTVSTGSRNAIKNVFALYPNPTTNKVTVKTSLQITSLRLVSQMGTVLTETSDNTLSLESYPEGVYFIYVELENGESGVEKIVLVK